jgi:hypothetical protein
VVFPRFEYVNRPQPETGLDGKFSVQYTTAVALLDGEITVDSFNNERRFAPDVVALLPKVTLRFDDDIPNDFDRMHIDMTVTLTDGCVLRLRVDKLSGWVGSPLTREQRLKKFYSCARRVLTKDSADRIVALVENLEQKRDVDELMALVRAGSPEKHPALHVIRASGAGTSSFDSSTFRVGDKPLLSFPRRREPMTQCHLRYSMDSRLHGNDKVTFIFYRISRRSLYPR